ncbi:glutathionylspermidine synthase family protein [Modestobacter sp. I12A-02628]|uniref:Glutathionylspermidine synthase family protein n=1 Tax=Goekera deserti TaxID=2497753 RepID=A0A7K3WBI6_9ACTN|nr:glutathionylspermidine synthase family protein [Goekera deserti]MPQ98253.1 glutathionylspermidine synthase family protein [Goekera deserti]NDI48079.1 glutathionylspermidine synthase family protein [Goekera deserti]NEL53828.1 glutathionylspermidine synthase family protein [Goekera deserti]
MRRLYGTARLGWQAAVEAEGLVYNRTEVPGADPVSYWREDVFYDFSTTEIDTLFSATQQLFAACVEAGDRIVASDELLQRMRVPRDCWDVVRRDWEAEPPSVYGRFDLSWGGEQSGELPKLLEFNADTPTSLVESAVSQWSWHLETGNGLDQWNRLDEALIEAWTRNLRLWELRNGRKPHVHLAWTSEDRSGEDQMTVAYMADCVRRAGYEFTVMTTEQIQLDPGDAYFYDAEGRHLDVVFKLYPWEWLAEDAFGPSVVADLRRGGGTTWVEPVYKMLWSNKGLLPVLWQLFEHDSVLSRYLLPAYFADDPARLDLVTTGYATKPLLGREGANVELRAPRSGELLAEAGGRYGAGGRVWQQLHPLPDFAGPDGPHHPVLGTWVVDGHPEGMGIRESDGLITDNLSHFAPHTIDHHVREARRP